MEVIKGQRYMHFKGHAIKVLEIAKHTETEEMMVVYLHEGTNEVWARPYDMFISKVDKEKYPEVEQEYRFQLMDEDVSK